MRLETRVRDLQGFSTSVEVKQLSMAKLHDDLEKKVLHAEQSRTLSSGAMTLLRASTLVSTLLRVVSRTWGGGVKTLLRVSTLLRVASSSWCMVCEGAPLAGSGNKYPGVPEQGIC